MTVGKTQLTISVDPYLSSYAEQLVDAGQAASVSAAFNDAMAEKAYRDRRRRSFFKTKADAADPQRVSRIMAGIDQQLALGAEACCGSVVRSGSLTCSPRLKEHCE